MPYRKCLHGFGFGTISYPQPLLNVVHNIFINDFYFANKRYSKQSIFWLLFKKNRQICITLEQDDSDRLWTILILLIKSQNVMDFWLVVLFLQGPRLYLRASTSLSISLDWYFLLVGIILSNVCIVYTLALMVIHVLWDLAAAGADQDLVGDFFHYLQIVTRNWLLGTTALLLLLRFLVLFRYRCDQEVPADGPWVKMFQ